MAIKLLVNVYLFCYLILESYCVKNICVILNALNIKLHNKR